MVLELFILFITLGIVYVYYINYLQKIKYWDKYGVVVPSYPNFPLGNSGQFNMDVVLNKRHPYHLMREHYEATKD